MFKQNILIEFFGAKTFKGRTIRKCFDKVFMDYTIFSIIFFNDLHENRLID